MRINDYNLYRCVLMITLKGLNFAGFADFAHFRENQRNLIPRKL